MRWFRFMRHGHEMLLFSRGSFSESELPLSYNAKVQNARAINWLRDQPFEQGMVIYVYIYRERVIFIISSDYVWIYEILQQ